MRSAYKTRENVTVGSTRKYGIELETASCDGWQDCTEKTMFEAKYDGSVSGMEFVSPVCNGDADLGRVVDFCRYANGKGFTVDKRCGFHIHFDVSSESSYSLKGIAYAYYLTGKVWGRFVKRARRTNFYCGSVKWDVNDMLAADSFAYFAGCQDRYCWFNIASFRRHGTFEVRLHGATLDANKVCAWIKAHTRFADWAASHTHAEIAEKFSGSDEEVFAAMCEIWGDDELSDYYAERGRFVSL